jgi:hypothetical protein
VVKPRRCSSTASVMAESQLLQPCKIHDGEFDLFAQQHCDPRPAVGST